MATSFASDGEKNLAGKVLIDIANPLDFSKGMPPSLTVCNTDSLGEQIQRAFPQTKVVKTLNTMNAYLMVDRIQTPTLTTPRGTDARSLIVAFGVKR